jgi:hypothetical protein
VEWSKRPAGRKNFGMRELAILLTEDNPSRQERCVAQVLQFFGVASRNLTAAEFATVNPAGDASSDRPRVLCSAEVFLRLIEDLARNSDMTAWWGSLHSAFVYAGDDFEALQKLARILTGDDGAVLREINPCIGDLVVSDHLNDFCEVMAGVRVTVSRANVAASLALNTSKAKANAINVISVDHGATFLKLEYKGVAVCLSTSKRIINVDAKVASRHFDVRDHFLSAVPIVLYIKWAFAETCWKSPETNACLVIDDPLLKPSYGCINFKELLALMERHYFSTNIAFIPWNWRRSNPKVAGLFRQKPEHYSLSIHGSDHMAEEFGSRDRERLRWKAGEAVDRMSSHETQTGIHYDRVMVFPQGVFSEAAMDVLKHSNFTAAVNSEIMSADPHPKAIRISDVWDIALMRYGSFPMFTRRDPSHGIENFAFDILLGKPCVIATHHDFCRNRYKHLVDFITRLKALNCPLSWRSLGEVVKRSCRQRELSPGVLEIEMYGAELRLENRSGQRERYLIRKRECEPSAIKEIRDGSGPIAWNSVNDHINFETELGSGQSKTVGIRFHELAGNGDNAENVSFRFRTMLRRYLSEVRDNYMVKNNLDLSGLFG